MVRHGAYGPEQLISLIIYVVEQALEKCILKQHEVVKWLPNAVARIRVKTMKRSKLSEIAPRTLHGLLKQLKLMRTLEMNAKLSVYRVSFRACGAEFEREQVSEAVQDGRLKLDRTTTWLDQAYKALDGQPQLSRATMVAVHRQGIKALLVQLAMRNTRVVSGDKLPEILALDAERLGNFRCQLRKLAVGSALFTLLKTVFKAVKFELSIEEGQKLQQRVLGHIGELNQSEQLCTAVIQEAQAMVGDAKPLPETLAMGLRACLKKKQGSLRVLFTERIASEVMAHEHKLEQVHSSLSMVREAVHELAVQVDKLCSYLELAYAQLYTALLKSREDAAICAREQAAACAEEAVAEVLEDAVAPMSTEEEVVPVAEVLEDAAAPMSTAAEEEDSEEVVAPETPSAQPMLDEVVDAHWS
jgi:hypothetical protein